MKYIIKYDFYFSNEDLRDGVNYIGDYNFYNHGFPWNSKCFIINADKFTLKVARKIILLFKTSIYNTKETNERYTNFKIKEYNEISNSL